MSWGFPKRLSLAAKQYQDLAHRHILGTRTADHHTNTLYTTGYWEITGNRKHSFEYYQSLARRTFRLLKGGYVVVHTDSGWFADTAAQEIPTNKLLIVNSSLEVLPARGAAGQLLECWKRQDCEEILNQHYADGKDSGLYAKEKGWVHYHRDLRKSGEQICLNLLTIWLSKFQLCLSSYALTGASSAWLGWTDASLARFNYRRTNWDIQRLVVDANKLIHYPSNMRFLGQRLPLNASFLLGKPKIMSTIADELHTVLMQALNDAYCHDEETLLRQVILRHPDWFAAIQ